MSQKEREEMYQKGVGLLTAACIVAVSWALVALVGSTATPAILTGPVLMGGFYVWRGMRP